VVQNEQKSVFICFMDRFDTTQYVKDRATIKNALVANMLFWSHFNSLFCKQKWRILVKIWLIMPVLRFYAMKTRW